MVSRLRYLTLLLSAILVIAGIPSVSVISQSLPPDRQAFQDATRITEPDKKIAALEKFIADFPKSIVVSSAHLQIFETLVKSTPDQKDKILEQAAKAIEKTPESSRPFIYDQLANRLFQSGVLLDEAEKFSNKAITLTDEELAKQAKLRKAGNYATLGRINLKQGKLKDAERHLKLAKEFNPMLSAASIGMAELLAKQGKDKEAIEAYANAAASGQLPKESREQFETLYAKANNGSMKGFNEFLDAKYLKLYPSPVTVTHYTPSAKRTNHTALAEVFTGSGCPPCVAADLGFDAMMERYKRDELTVLMYHLHIPRPDPMTSLATQARAKYYKVESVPSYVVDGRSSVGGGSREMTQNFYDRVNPDIEKLLEKPSGADVKLDVVLENTTVKARVALSKINSESDSLKLQIVLAEDRLRFQGENGIRFHPMVVRSIAGPEFAGITLKDKSNQNIEWSFELPAISEAIKKHLDDFEMTPFRGESYTFNEKKYQIDPANLTVVAFLQDDKTKNVLQAVSMKVRPVVASTGN